MVVVYSREAKRKREKEGRESVLFELLIKVRWYYISDESSFLS